MTLGALNNLLLATILFTSTFVVQEDIKTKRIPNKFIFGAGSFGLFLYGAGVMSGVMEGAYLARVMMNTLLSFVVSFAIWEWGLWPAGDAKFFILVSFLLPLHYYAQTYLPFFPSFALLVNVFSVYLFLLVLKLLLWGWYRFFKLSRKVCARYARRKGDKFLRSLRGRKLSWALCLKMGMKLLITSLTVIFFAKGSFQLRPFVIYFLFFLFIRILSSIYVNSYSRKRIRVSAITAGMNLSEAALNQLKTDKNFFKSLETLRAEGLTDHQAISIREHFLARKIVSVDVHETISFSPFIVLGAVATMLVKGSILYFFCNTPQ